MEKEYSAVVFDVDGTLLNTKEGILSASLFSIKKMGYKVPDESVLETFIGPPIQDSFARVFGVSGLLQDQMASVFRKRYKEKDLLKAIPYDGIADALFQLRTLGYKLAVATYKRQDYAEKIMNHFGLDKFMDCICGADFEGKLKKADIILNAIKNVGESPESSVMVGDTLQDSNGARALNVDFIGVTYGFGFKNKDDIRNICCVGAADSPKEIVDLLKRVKK